MKSEHIIRTSVDDGPLHFREFGQTFVATSNELLSSVNMKICSSWELFVYFGQKIAFRSNSNSKPSEIGRHVCSRHENPTHLRSRVLSANLSLSPLKVISTAVENPRLALACMSPALKDN